MEKLNIGDYVRTKNGYIDQVVSINKKDMCGEYPRPSVSLSKYFINCFIDEIAKHSKDIIKVLEKGDICIDYNDDLYVVDHIFSDYVFTTTKVNKTTVKTLADYQIKKVITKEVFEANAYVLEKEK